jgi:cytochrome c biogenesis protein CcmG/thiol:disulfide interchange protein DsbE
VSGTGQTPPPAQSTAATKTRLLFLVPLGLFLGLALILSIGLRLGDPGELPSALIGAPAPDFVLPPIEGAPPVLPGLAKADLEKGQVILLNVWASWCGPCRIEHPVLMDIAASGEVALYGLNYKDEAPEALNFLAALGNPYSRSGADKSGRVGIDFGVYGVPETFVINGQGEIIYKHVGPLTARSWKNDIRPIVEAAKAAATSTAPAS